MKRINHTIITIVIVAFSLSVTALALKTDEQSGDQPSVDATARPEVSLESATFGVSGAVEVEVQIDVYGRVTTATFVTGSRQFQNACEDAARRWLFAPKTDGEGVRKASLRFEFESVAWNAPGELIEVKYVPPYLMKIRYKQPRRAEIINYIPADWTGTERCEVHAELLKKDKVPIYYGLRLVIYSDDYLETERRQFPHANEDMHGGCVDEDAKYAEVLYCQKCREAKRQLRNDQPSQKD